MRAPIITLALVLWAPSALAEGYRLRADALAQAQAPLGVLSLSGNSQLMPGAEAEAWLWMSGGDQVSPEFDALVASLAYRDPEGRGVARVGRFILSSGALPPIHQDGALGIINLPWRGTVELFAGLPVRPRFGERNFNWLAGGRLGQAVGPVQAGLAYYQRRDDGALADHELAFDAYTYLFERFSLAVRASADLINFGLSQGTLAAGYDLGPLRLEGTFAQRSPSRLLPATSLFSVLGDQALRFGNLRVAYRIAPRLQVIGTVGARFYDDEPALDLILASRLWLDRLGQSAVGLELRRQGAPDGGWMGVRATGRYFPIDFLVLSTELELVRPDDPTAEEGKLWPWALLAIGLRPDPSWIFDVAGEASASPTARSSYDLLLRVAYQPELP